MSDPLTINLLVRLWLLAIAAFLFAIAALAQPSPLPGQFTNLRAVTATNGPVTICYCGGDSLVTGDLYPYLLAHFKDLPVSQVRLNLP